MEQTQHKKNNRITIIAFLALFTLPVIIAWTAYFSGWFDSVDTTNKGEWVVPILSFEDYSPVYSDGTAVALEPGETWKLIMPAKVSECQIDDTDTECLINLYLLGQTHMALGKDNERLERILYNGTANYTEEQLKTLKERFLDMKVVNNASGTAKSLPDNYIYIIDPVGNIILRYPFVTKQEDVFLKGKDILKDLKKLLKLSRLG